MFRYPALKIIAVVWKTLGCIALIISMGVVAFAIFADDATFSSLPIRAVLARWIVLIVGVFMTWFSLFGIAQGEIIRVFIDIEANTRASRSMLLSSQHDPVSVEDRIELAAREMIEKYGVTAEEQATRYRDRMKHEGKHEAVMRGERLVEAIRRIRDRDASTDRAMSERD
jgi:hypothetical protein